MTLRLVELRKTRRTGEVEVIEFDRNVTVLVGPRNTSKTTMLRMIDFCLGDSDSASAALREPVAEAYAALQLTIEINDSRYVVHRSLLASEGYVTKIQVGEMELSTRDFQRWVMNQLGWPEIAIPKGRAYRSASEVVPLTFRTLFRHVLRKETSWTEFAIREEEFLRRAVIAFFLGVAEARFKASLLEYGLGETQRQIETLEARRREVAEQGELLARRFGRALGLESVSLERLESLGRDLSLQRDEVQARRLEILGTLRSSEGFGVEPGERFQTVQSQAEELTTRVVELRRAAAGYREALAELEGQMLKLQRAEAAVDAFVQVPVQQCPACGQVISHSGDGHECYLCGQATTPDVRARRIELEISALGREAVELREVLSDTTSEIEDLQTTIDRLVHERDELRVQLDRERRELIAPYLTELEGLSAELGALDQQIAMLGALQTLNERVDSIESQLAETSRQFDAQAADADRLLSQRALEEERASGFATTMTRFLSQLKTDSWDYGPVTIASVDFSFYLGPLGWESVLGAESRVLFFLAYTDALLRVGQLGSGTRPPGLAILDNPMQHGITDEVVTEALQQLAHTARELDGQLIVTLPRNLSFDREARIVSMDEEFAPA
jgi:hypothetical protein